MTPQIIENKFDYIELERVTLDDGVRFYNTPDNEKVSSVTTILSATDTNTDGLVQWRNRIGNKAADAIMEEACNLGSLMHEHLECYVQNLERPKGNNILRVLSKSMADKIIDKGLCHIDEIWGMEKMLYFPSAYAGTADLIAVHKGSPAICDYKSCRKMKDREKIDNYYCQLAAYAIAHNHLYDTDIRKGVIFMVDRDLNFNEYVIEGAEFDRACDMWISRLEIFLENQRMKEKFKS